MERTESDEPIESSRIEQDRKILSGKRRRRFTEPGGTPGGLGMFAIGAIITVGGGYLIMEQVKVTSGYWYWWGPNTFGLTLIPLLLGVALLFYNGKSLVGWLLALGGAVIIFTGIIASLQIHFSQTSLFNTLLMLFLFIGGLALMARALRSS